VPGVFAQTGTSYRTLVDAYLQRQASALGLEAEDLAGWEVTDEASSQRPDVTHVYIRQTYQGIPVFNGVANFLVKNGQVLHMGQRLQKDLAGRANATQPGLGAEQAIAAAATALGLPAPAAVRFLEARSPREYRYSGGNLSRSDIPVQLMYLPGPEDELTLVWDLALELTGGDHWWSVRLDAQTGALLDKQDWIQHCAFPEHAFRGPHTHAPHEAPLPAPMSPAGIQSGEQYRVFSSAIESPNHGPRSLEVSPADSLASPFGWHDVDGLAGADFTITRGNNVYASEDRNDDNVPGYSPDGGASLNFDFPLNLNQAAPGYQDASIVNLFYLNNMMHDIWYQYGFDEASGNFQENNYGRGGFGGDYVNADAQDGGGTNNANFGTPPDGQNPRMQMFLWTSNSGLTQLLTVNSPGSIAGAYTASEATFGPGVSATPLTADVVLVDDGVNPNPNDGCETLINAQNLSGKLALIDRGSCAFVLKVEAAQNAGAVGVIIANNVPGNPITMGGTSNLITIPSVMISLADGQALKARLAAGEVVNATLQNQSGNFDRDGSFDNGIIAHEYTHGISNRLTGGGSNAGCLFNAEQMGEGWSDWFGLMISFNPTERNRGIGTFAIDEPTTGIGIRNAPYSPDFNVNPFTYANTNDQFNVSQPHGVGFVWCTMLWDLTLEFVDAYGYDPDLINGTGGNNMMMSLVTEGLKIQPCNPGFVDGRDAILVADQLLFGGANQCLIWEVFARRGLGASAQQGNIDSRTDQVEAFDLPVLCQTPVTPPAAAFNLEAGAGCGNKFFFTDQSTDVPQQWFWDFGDGTVDSTQSPEHTYTSSGTYAVTLVVSNSLGNDTSVQIVTVNLPAGPVITVGDVCVGEAALLVANQPGNYWWYDNGGNLLAVNQVFQTAPLSADTSIFVSEVIPGQAFSAGPVNGNIGPGGYHNTGFTGTLNFTAQDAFTLVSVWVDAGSPGTRTIFLWQGIDGNGAVVDQVTVNLPAGPQRVTLNLDVPGPGTYSVGGTSIDLYRNSSGVSYPYVVPGLLSINSSSATTGPQSFYYYLYDWEVRGPECTSERVEVPIAVAEASFDLAQTVANAPEVSFTDQSAGASSWLWDFGDGNSSTQQNPVHTYANSGTFVVTLTVNGSCTATDTLDAWLVGLEALAPGLEVSLSPNPASSFATLQLSQGLPATLQLRLFASDGRLVQVQQLAQGQLQTQLYLSSLSAGIYLLELEAMGHRSQLRLVVQR